MGEIVALNAWLQARINAERVLLNFGRTLCLFINDFTPTPADSLASFTEATFPGYLPRDLATLWTIPTKVQDGEYVTNIPKQSWLCTGTAAQVVYGWFILHGGTVELALRHLSPTPVSNGVTVEAQAHYITRSLSLHD